MASALSSGGGAGGRGFLGGQGAGLLPGLRLGEQPGSHCHFQVGLDPGGRHGLVVQKPCQHLTFAHLVLAPDQQLLHDGGGPRHMDDPLPRHDPSQGHDGGRDRAGA